MYFFFLVFMSCQLIEKRLSASTTFIFLFNINSIFIANGSRKTVWWVSFNSSAKNEQQPQANFKNSHREYSIFTIDCNVQCAHFHQRNDILIHRVILLLNQTTSLCVAMISSSVEWLFICLMNLDDKLSETKLNKQKKRLNKILSSVISVACYANACYCSFFAYLKAIHSIIFPFAFSSTRTHSFMKVCADIKRPVIRPLCATPTIN